MANAGKVTKRPSLTARSVVVPVRLDETLLSAVDDQAAREHVTRSDVVGPTRSEGDLVTHPATVDLAYKWDISSGYA